MKISLTDCERISNSAVFPPWKNKGSQYVVYRAKTNIAPKVKKNDILIVQRGNRAGCTVIVNKYSGRTIGTVVELRRRITYL